MLAFLQLPTLNPYPSFGQGVEDRRCGLQRPDAEVCGLGFKPLTLSPTGLEFKVSDLWFGFWGLGFRI